MAEEPPEYVYVEPYHHANTTKHGESNWSWVKLWKDKYKRPVPPCCPCKGGGEGGEEEQNKKKKGKKKEEDFPHPITQAVGAHVKLKKTGQGNHKTVPAIIPACSSCNKKGAKFEWNADAILLTGSRPSAGTTEPIFFGKLFLHEGKGGPYWTKVHRVKREGKKLTCVQGEFNLITEDSEGTRTLRVGVPPPAGPAAATRQQTDLNPGLVQKEFKDSKVELNNKQLDKKKNLIEEGWWYYEDDTGFVYDLLRGANNDEEKPIVCVADKVRKEFNEEKVIDRVQCVYVIRQKRGFFTLKKSPDGKKMPSVIEQIVHCMRRLAIDHKQSMDDILQFACQQEQIRNENETRTLTQ